MFYFSVTEKQLEHIKDKDSVFIDLPYDDNMVRQLWINFSEKWGKSCLQKTFDRMNVGTAVGLTQGFDAYWQDKKPSHRISRKVYWFKTFTNLTVDKRVSSYGIRLFLWYNADTRSKRFIDKARVWGDMLNPDNENWY